MQALWGAGSKGKSTIPNFTSFFRNGDTFSFGLKSWPNLRYQIEFSPTLLPADYQDIGVSFTANPAGQTDVIRTLSTSSPTGYFRAYEVPRTLGRRTSADFADGRRLQKSSAKICAICGSFFPIR